jgi:GNAT superfamily N-acetyltransferase
MALLYPVSFVENPTEHDHKVIFDKINAFARSQGLQAASGSYFFTAYDADNKIIAAISGFDNFGCVEIGGLWVHKAFRSMGYGTTLVQKAQEWGRKSGCSHMTVFTLKQWPAYTWYQKLGFTVEFERHGHTGNMAGCYLIKKL